MPRKPDSFYSFYVPSSDGVSACATSPIQSSSSKAVKLHCGEHDLSICCLSLLKFENSLGIDCPALDSIRYRLQALHFTHKNKVAALNNLTKLFKERNIEVQVFVEGAADEMEEHLASDWKSRSDCTSVPSFVLKGYDFLLSNIRDEAYYALNTDIRNKITFTNDLKQLYPHILLLVNNEVSFIKVTATNMYELLDCSQLNIKTVFSMCKPSVDTIEEFIRFVGLAKLFLSMTASVPNQIPEHEKEGPVFEEAREAYRLVTSFYINIAQMSTSFAKMLGIKKIIVKDSLTNELFIKEVLADNIKQFSESTIEAVFLRHENFIRGIGSLLSCTSFPEKSWSENYSESSGMAHQFCFFDGIDTTLLTMDSLDDTQLSSPVLLNPISYNPDKQNLNIDFAAREYWIKCVKEGIPKGVQGQLSATSNVKAVERLQNFKERALERMDYLYFNPQSYGELSFRIVHDTIEHMRQETGLIAMYEKRKELENDLALKELEERLKYIDSLDHDERQEELIISILAGNMFDWGSAETAKLMLEGKFGFMEAMEKLPVRPWLIDDLDGWVKRTHGAPHSLAMIFCDNCGYDLILGILPFTRELLLKGTKVILCVNDLPRLNDVTLYDLKLVLERIKPICPVIKNSYENNDLSILKISKSSCFLDFRSVDAEIAKKMTEIDLLVIEGMGRAIHTNLEAEFNCEALRVGVVKDRWFSQQLGGESFACICKHTL